MNTRLLALAALTAALSMSAACGSQGGGSPAAPVAANETATDMASETPSEAASETPSASASPTATGTPVGAGCSSLPASGKGSPAELAKVPVGTALSDIPSLSTLARVVKKAGLAETLNSAQDITVFAPTNEAFNKIPKSQLDQLMSNRKSLRGLLAYHVVKGRKAPADMHGQLTSLEGRKLTVSGSDSTLKVNDATVTCGNIATSNATVYAVDKVLMPR
ncbi:Uncaracterized surface protein containing fasciclin (FAS1) repeats [Microbispora rosea]|uniref:Uncaracterized surface protein containing fasciclin (FAS1) repeats n=1 Tax=Microbispora rosea TaxID=58117 RepID=A0A1N6ULU3_9ACTN|nr:fasciclin domain-containing protein [Microbispora rosea]GIH46580.1 lipoprotein [Microbispora rosea subsp. rosea]SIQ66618.1 Uncaracterized surface protein containing fasciclin (FAS1) repeats [Microbispora rosea]